MSIRKLVIVLVLLEHLKYEGLHKGQKNPLEHLEYEN